MSNTDKVLELIKWFKSEADLKYRVFLIGGVPSGWRNLTLDSRTEPAWRSVYESLDGIHPWHVGRWETISGFDSFYYKNVITPDAALCSELGILYMPTMCKSIQRLCLLNDGLSNVYSVADLLTLQGLDSRGTT